jgi:hypothetical protein
MTEQNHLTIEASGEKSFGPCDCCGEMTSRVWGFVYDSGVAAAAYYVEWTAGHDGASAAFDLIIGAWGDNTGAADRQAVSLDFRKSESGPAFMVVDAGNRTVASSPLISKALNRDEVIGSEIATRVFAVCNTIYLGDPRLSVLRGVTLGKSGFSASSVPQ